MSKWKFRVSNPRGPLEVTSSHLLNGKMRPREGRQPSGPHSELVAQLGCGLPPTDFSLCEELSHRVALVSQNLHQVTIPVTSALRGKQAPLSRPPNEDRPPGPMWPYRTLCLRRAQGPCPDRRPA